MMIIIGVALLEERKMRHFSGKAYEDDRERASFLLPLPRFLRKAFAAPIRLFIGKSVPERKGHIAAVLILATAGPMVASHFYASYRRYAGSSTLFGLVGSDRARVEKLVEEMKRTEDWRRKSRIAEALGEISSDKALDRLARDFAGEDVHVRRSILVALLRIGSNLAAGTLEAALNDEDKEVRLYAAEALKRVRDMETSR
jgi:hypothetical protein